MRGARFLLLILVLSGAVASFAGDIQVFCEPGVRVYLDDELVGTCSRLDDGAYLMDVAEGTHTLRVEKDGFVPQSYEVVVGQVPIEVTVGELAPAPPATSSEAPADSEPAQAIGSLIVTSAPQHCMVEVDGTEWAKVTPQLTIGGLGAGEHTVTFSKPGYDPVSEKVTIRPGAAAMVHGNLKTAEVEFAHLGRGSLRVVSQPKRCTVRFLGMIREKTALNLNLTRIPAGEYPIVISIPGRELSTKVLISNGQRTILKVSFMEGDDAFAVSYGPE